jgi:hypothetical protein
MSLADQLLKRLDRGRTLSRGEFLLNADYDSVGRTLRQLMKDKRVERVGRGQYRKAKPGKRPAITETIGAAIARKVRRSKRNVFLRSDFAPLGSYDAVGRALRQKATEGQLVQIGYGLYANAEVSPFTGKPVPIVGIKKPATRRWADLARRWSRPLLTMPIIAVARRRCQRAVTWRSRIEFGTDRI